MSSFKKLSKADVTTVPYAANKQWNLTYAGVSNEYIASFIGTNRSFNTYKVTSNNQYRSLVYSSINHLFYQQYTSSLDTGSLMFNINTYESASSQRPTASYFDYNNSPYLIKDFPAALNSSIGVLSINQSIYGSKILPNSFRISASVGNYNGIIKDDGYGNLYDVAQALDQYIDLSWVTLQYTATGSSGFSPSLLPPGVFLVGNIFYAHGIAVLSNNTYVGIPTSTTSIKGISFNNEHIIYENEVRCIVRESDFNVSYNPTLVTGSYENGILKDFATGSTFQPYVTTIGLYNDENDLLMVAKLSKPIVLSSDTDMTFIVKYDT